MPLCFDVIRYENKKSKPLLEQGPLELCFYDSNGELHYVHLKSSEEKKVYCTLKKNVLYSYQDHTHLMNLSWDDSVYCEMTFKCYTRDEWNIEGVKVKINTL
jgi:hypothetical protein